MSQASDADTIHKAVRRGDLGAVCRFVEVEGVDVDCKDENGETPLIVAAEMIGPSIPHVVRYLISQNANVEATADNRNRGQFYDGCTALMLASSVGNVEAVNIMLEEGRANVNSDCNGNTALWFATISHAGSCVVPTLLQHGADTRSKWARSSPLLSACSMPGAVKVVQQLVEHGADVTGGAIYYAAIGSDAATVRLLLANGANVNHCHLCHSPPIFEAALRGNVSIVQTLLEHNAKIDKVIFGKKNILHTMPDADVLAIILEHCRSTMTEDKFDKLLLQADLSGNIALHYTHRASSRGQSVRIAKLLIEQPRRQDKHLPPICYAQLVHQNDVPSLSAPRYHPSLHAYLKSFESLVLSIPGAATYASSASKRRKTAVHDKIAVKLNPSLNDFQRSVADEALVMIMKATRCPECIAYAIAGYLSPLDVMKR